MVVVRTELWLTSSALLVVRFEPGVGEETTSGDGEAREAACGEWDAR